MLMSGVRHCWVLNGANREIGVPRLGADEAGVEGAGDGGVFCAFDYGAAVGEDCYFVGGSLEAEQELVVPNFGSRCGGGCGSQAAAECS